MFEIVAPKGDPHTTIITVIGVGGCGCNAVDYMIKKGTKLVNFVVANTDHQALTNSLANSKIQLGNTGLGAGAKPEVGAEAAREQIDDIREAIKGTHLLFITAGMGGGTGTGAAPIVAEVAREMGILTVAVVTRPFSFEGTRRARIAQEGILNLKDKVDSMLVILNQKLEETDDQTTMQQCFAMSNDVLYQACNGITEVLLNKGDINRDFEDINTIMRMRGNALIGVASASGPNRAQEAAEKAISCKLLEGQSLTGAQALLVYIRSDDSITMAETKTAMQILETFLDPNALVLFGSATDPSMGDELSITIVATGISDEEKSSAYTKEVQWDQLIPSTQTPSGSNTSYESDRPTFVDESTPKAFAPAATVATTASSAASLTPSEQPSQPVQPELTAFSLQPEDKPVESTPVAKPEVKVEPTAQKTTSAGLNLTEKLFGQSSGQSEKRENNEPVKIKLPDFLK